MRYAAALASLYPELVVEVEHVGELALPDYDRGGWTTGDRAPPWPFAADLSVLRHGQGTCYDCFDRARQAYNDHMPPVAVLVSQVEERARRDPDFAGLLEELLEAPTAPREQLERVAAQKINVERRNGLMRDFLDGAISTREAQSCLGYDSPQAIHQLRRRGQLLGMTVGNNTWFPAWQFEADRLRPDLPEILTLLARFTSDPVVGDRIMRIKRADLAGVSISEALRRKKTAATARQMLAALGA